MLSHIGETGQLALQKSKVLIVGLGGLGNPNAQYLAASGIGSLYLSDGDTIELTNLPRQTLFNEKVIGENKADIAQQKLTEQYPDIDIEAIDEMIDDELAQYYIPQVDLVIDCTDNIAARYLLNKHCRETKTPLIIGAATGFNGQCLVIDPRLPESACYQCLFPESKKAPSQNCSMLGILGPVLAIIAGMQSLQAIKLLTNNKTPTNRFFMFDGLESQWNEFALHKNSGCPACGSSINAV